MDGPLDPCDGSQGVREVDSPNHQWPEQILQSKGKIFVQRRQNWGSLSFTLLQNKELGKPVFWQQRELCLYVFSLPGIIFPINKLVTPSWPPNLSWNVSWTENCFVIDVPLPRPSRLDALISFLGLPQRITADLVSSNKHKKWSLLSLKSRCWQDSFLPKALREHVFHASP